MPTDPKEKPQPSLSDSEERGWKLYHKKTQGKDPHRVLRKAIELHALENCSGKMALDLGCGGGRDSLFLLKMGWQVVAMDKSASAIETLRKSATDICREDKIEFVHKSFENVTGPVGQFDLIQAGVSVPFCHPDNFSKFWESAVVNSLVSGGRFAGHFFGDKDDWAYKQDMVFVDQFELNEMFRDFDLEFFKESETDKADVHGQNKHWHIFELVARKK